MYQIANRDVFEIDTSDLYQPKLMAKAEEADVYCHVNLKNVLSGQI